MYAQLCKRLDENAPNFEPSGSNVKTFRRLLISKCQDEFENRSRAFAAFDKQNGALTQDEEDQRNLAKLKMLGNIQFIGELGKLEMLHESILHRCIKQLLEKKSRESLRDKAEDLECLCKIITTVGRQLDHDKARAWMDTYFERMTRFSESIELPSRIRFMLQDCMDLRNNKWVPRRHQTDHGPRTIRQIHQEEAKNDHHGSQSLSRFNQPDFFSMNGERGFASGPPWAARGGMADLFLQDTMSGRVGAGPGVISDELSPPPVFESYSPRMQHRQPQQQQQQRGSSNRSDSGDRQSQGHQHQGGYQAPRFQQNRNQQNPRGPGRDGGNGMQPQQQYQQRYQPQGRENQQQGRGNQQLQQPLQPPQQQQQPYQGNYNKQPNKQYYNKENQEYRGRGSGERDRDRDRDRDRGGGGGNRGPDRGYGQRQDRQQGEKMYGGGMPRDGGGMQRDGGGGGGGGGGPRQRDDGRDMRPSRMNKMDSGEINLRPSSNMMLKPQGPRFLPPSAMSNAPSSSPPLGMTPLQSLLPQNPAAGINQPPPLQAGYPGLPVKQQGGSGGGGGSGAGGGAAEKKQEKKKQPTKEELLKSMEELLTAYLSSKDSGQAVQAFKALQAPKKHIPALLSFIMTHCIQLSDAEREAAAALLSGLKKEGSINGNNFMEAFSSFLECSKELESEVPLIKSHTAGLAAGAVTDEVVSLADIAGPLENGAFYPLFLLVLQRIAKARGREALVAVFNSSKVDMLRMLPESDRNKEKMMEILEGKNLSFLFPLLRMQADVTKQLQTDPSPNALYKWIRDNVSATLQKDKGFINALTASVIRYIVGETSLSEGADPTVLPEKPIQEKEKGLLEKFAPVLTKFFHESIDLQLSALYALQTQCHNLSFPKGMLLRFFVNLYNLEVIEEEAFIKWKEDITDEFPGKGQALFQVNQWLTWLATAEEEDDSDEETED
ncbi:eukaryotic translation initiation factor 4 gamma 2-like [Diadema setosum]|uniref:eukaryotic translation initiation factor 4 gamma 2-like n=1 Tax=Diadema setosum TaxID=31175 RepID=UPI003B3A7E31